MITPTRQRTHTLQVLVAWLYVLGVSYGSLATVLWSLGGGVDPGTLWLQGPATVQALLAWSLRHRRQRQPANLQR